MTIFGELSVWDKDLTHVKESPTPPRTRSPHPMSKGLLPSPMEDEVDGPEDGGLVVDQGPKEHPQTVVAHRQHPGVDTLPVAVPSRPGPSETSTSPPPSRPPARSGPHPRLPVPVPSRRHLSPTSRGHGTPSPTPRPGVGDGPEDVQQGVLKRLEEEEQEPVTTVLREPSVPEPHLQGPRYPVANPGVLRTLGPRRVQTGLPSVGSLLGPPAVSESRNHARVSREQAGLSCCLLGRGVHRWRLARTPRPHTLVFDGPTGS